MTAMALMLYRCYCIGNKLIIVEGGYFHICYANVRSGFQTVVWTTADYFACLNYGKYAHTKLGELLASQTRLLFPTHIGERASASHAHCKTLANFQAVGTLDWSG